MRLAYFEYQFVLANKDLGLKADSFKNLNPLIISNATIIEQN